MSRPLPSLWSTAVTNFKMHCSHNGKAIFFSNSISNEVGFCCEYGCGFHLNYDWTKGSPQKFPDGIAYGEREMGKVITFAKEGTKMRKD